MRDFVDAILEVIGSESLTDVEWDTIESEDEEYTQELYLEMKEVLEGREDVSDQPRKLKLYFEARGVDLSGETSYTAKSNIYLGSAL